MQPDNTPTASRSRDVTEGAFVLAVLACDRRAVEGAAKALLGGRKGT